MTRDQLEAVIWENARDITSPAKAVRDPAIDAILRAADAYAETRRQAELRFAARRRRADLLAGDSAETERRRAIDVPAPKRFTRRVA